MKKAILAVLVLASVSAHASDYVGSGDYRADKDAQYARDQGQDAAIHEVHMNMLTKYSESWGLEDRANIAGLQESKVDKSVFTADQLRQDKALAASVTKQEETDAKQTTGLKDYADKKATSAYQTAVAHTDVKVARADADRLKGDQALNTRIEQEQSNRATNDRVITDRVRKEEVSRAADTGDIRTSIKERNAVVDNRFNDTDSRIAENKASQQKVNESMAGELDNHDQRIGTLEQSTNANFTNLGSRVDKLSDKVEQNRKKANAGTSSALAAAGIPQVTGEQRFSLGAAVGGYESENALAVGFSSRVTSNVVIKAAVATDSQHGVGYNAGLSVGW